MKDKPLHQCDCGEPMVEAASGDNLVANYACPKCSRKPTAMDDAVDRILDRVFRDLNACGLNPAGGRMFHGDSPLRKIVVMFDDPQWTEANQ